MKQDMDVKEQMTYLIFDGRLYKIGKSKDPIKRLKSLRTSNPFVEMVCYGSGVSEKYLHELLFRDRVKLEWFQLDEAKLATVKRLIEKGEKGRVRTANPKFESIEIQGVKFKGKRISGKYHTLSDSEKKRNSDGVLRSERLSKSYVINFGKYNGVKITDMISDEQIDYVQWLYDQMSSYSKSEKKKSRKYKAFSWWLRNYEKFGVPITEK